MVTMAKPTFSFADLPEALRDAAQDARAKGEMLMLTEIEPGLFRIIPGYKWTLKTRAYITSKGDVVFSELAQRNGFKPPKLLSP